MRTGTVWKFAPKGSRFKVRLRIEQDRRYRYDGDDEEGETQAKLDAGEYVAFDSFAEVLLDGEVIGTDSLHGSVYLDGDESDFWTDHRSADPMNRNCTIMRAKRGELTCICHYFPDLIRSAVDEARQYVRDMVVPPRIRESAR